jgi:hypothetical protein
VEATQSDQIPSKVALGCGDRDAALGDRNVAADCSFARLEGDVVGCVTLGIDHAESVTDRHLRPLHDGPVRFDARGGREPGLEPAATPDGRARLGSVFGDRADVIRVGMCDGNVTDFGGVDGGVEVVGPARRVDQKRVVYDIRVGGPGGDTPLDRDGNPDDPARVTGWSAHALNYR